MYICVYILYIYKFYPMTFHYYKKAGGLAKASMEHLTQYILYNRGRAWKASNPGPLEQ